MTSLRPRKKAVRDYRKDTFKAYQEASVSKREQSLHEALVFLGKSGLKFKNITMLAEHVSKLFKKPIDPTTLLRNTKGRGISPNPYRIMLLQYLAGKYFAKDKAPRITALDIAEIRMKYPAVDAYCAQKEGDCANFEKQVKLLLREIEGLKESRDLLPQKTSIDSGLSRDLDNTITALVRLVVELSDFIAADWQVRAIVDRAYDSKVLVGPEHLSAFFDALEKAGMKPGG